MPQANARQAAGTYVDPFRAYNFKLEIGGVTEGHFTEVTGLGARITPISYREAGNNQVVHYVPGRVEYSEITLRYGVTNSRELFEWFRRGVGGNVERKNISIVLLNTEGAVEVSRWNLGNTWATEWRGSVLNAQSQEVAIESLTLVCESIDRS